MDAEERTITVGVTGHRWDADPAGLDEVIRRLLVRLAVLAGPGGGVTVISPLAEGADRLVASLALELAFRLECVLPFPPSDYVRDFGSAVSVAVFRRLLSRAHSVSIAECDGADDEREAAYAAAGRDVIERSDVIIAVWDGRGARGRGGTAEVIEAAIESGRLVIWVQVEPPYRVRVLGDAAATEFGTALRDSLDIGPAPNATG